MEGAPPSPAANYITKDDGPFSAIRYVNSKTCTYSYSSSKETGTDSNLTYSRGGGSKWEASAGLGMETQGGKRCIETSYRHLGCIYCEGSSNGHSYNTLDMRIETTSYWKLKDDKGDACYKPSNTDIALLESEVADVFALRLKLRGPVKPLVAYQMRPNPDIPKDRNLVSFQINPGYTKQGCLHERYGLKIEETYPQAAGAAPTGISYFKPAEAYALKNRIRRAEEQLAAEHQRHEFTSADFKGKASGLPKRSKRNICNSYVWSAAEGTFQETFSTMDFVQLEVGGSSNSRQGIGASLDMEISVATALMTINVDAMFATHFNMMLTKKSTTEDSFELQAELPPPIDIRVQDPVSKAYYKRQGAVEAYRWMSFWLEPSVDATTMFFQKVVDPQWLNESTEPDAVVLKELAASLKLEKSDMRTKAWRVFHRCTYVNRVLETIVNPSAADPNAEPTDKKTFADQSPSWALICAVEPYIRPSKDKSEIVINAEKYIKALYPALTSQPRLLDQVLNMLAEYLDVPTILSPQSA